MCEIKHLYMLCSRFIRKIFCDNLKPQTSPTCYKIKQELTLLEAWPHTSHTSTSNWLSPRDSNNNNNNINWLLLLLEIHKLLEKLVPPVPWNAQVGFPHRCLGISIHTRTHTRTFPNIKRAGERERATWRQFDAQCIQIELILVCKIFRH